MADQDANLCERETTIDTRIESLAATHLKELAQGVRSYFGDGPPDPDDVAQEAFHRVLQRGDMSTIKNLKGFLWRTARNLVFDAKKVEASRSKYDFEVEQIFFPLKGDLSSPENVISARQQLNAINQLLAKMPEKRRRALLLYRIEGLTLNEVARRLKVSRTAVSKHIANAHAELNALFIDDPEG